jgi:hypothetical protein
MSLIVVIIILVLLFGGLGFHSGWGYYGAGPLGGIGGLILIIVVVWLLTGGRL